MRSKCSRCIPQSTAQSSQSGHCWTNGGRQDSTGKVLVSRSGEEDTDGRDKVSPSVSVRKYTGDDFPERSAGCVSLCCYRLTCCFLLPGNHLDDGEPSFEHLVNKWYRPDHCRQLRTPDSASEQEHQLPSYRATCTHDERVQSFPDSPWRMRSYGANTSYLPQARTPDRLSPATYPFHLGS